MSVNTDCFAYNKEYNYCYALKVMQCAFGKCEFYKTKTENCAACKKAIGRTIECNECREITTKA